MTPGKPEPLARGGGLGEAVPCVRLSARSTRLLGGISGYESIGVNAVQIGAAVPGSATVGTVTNLNHAHRVFRKTAQPGKLASRNYRSILLWYLVDNRFSVKCKRHE